MPKKTKRESQKVRKKKGSLVENTAIKIVDEGESGIDVTDVVKKKKEEEAKKNLVPPSFVAKKTEQTYEEDELKKSICKLSETSGTHERDSLIVKSGSARELSSLETVGEDYNRQNITESSSSAASSNEQFSYFSHNDDKMEDLSTEAISKIENKTIVKEVRKMKTSVTKVIKSEFVSLETDDDHEKMVVNGNKSKRTLDIKEEKSTHSSSTVSQHVEEKHKDLKEGVFPEQLESEIIKSEFVFSEARMGYSSEIKSSFDINKENTADSSFSVSKFGEDQSKDSKDDVFLEELKIEIIDSEFVSLETNDDHEKMVVNGNEPKRSIDIREDKSSHSSSLESEIIKSDFVFSEARMGYSSEINSSFDINKENSENSSFSVSKFGEDQNKDAKDDVFLEELKSEIIESEFVSLETNDDHEKMVVNGNKPKRSLDIREEKSSYSSSLLSEIVNSEFVFSEASMGYSSEINSSFDINKEISADSSFSVSKFGEDQNKDSEDDVFLEELKSKIIKSESVSLNTDGNNKLTEARIAYGISNYSELQSFIDIKEEKDVSIAVSGCGKDTNQDLKDDTAFLEEFKSEIIESVRDSVGIIVSDIADTVDFKEEQFSVSSSSVFKYGEDKNLDLKDNSVFLEESKSKNTKSDSDYMEIIVSDLAGAVDPKEEKSSVSSSSFSKGVEDNQKLEDGVFLEELKSETLSKESINSSIEPIKRSVNETSSKKSLGWDSIFIKKSITIGVRQDSSTDLGLLEAWKERFRRLEREKIILTEDTIKKHFQDISTKVLDTETGFGFISESINQPKVKIILKSNSPFLNNDKKTRHLQLSQHHLYSQIYNVGNVEENGQTVYIFRHYLHISSLNQEQLESIKVAASDDDENITFLDPLYIDHDFIVVDQSQLSWFLVVSEFPNLPIKINLVPFTTRTSHHIVSNPPPPIFICPLPQGRHHITKVMEDNQGWRKCGYEEPLVIRKGDVYDFLAEGHAGCQVNIGKMKLETWGDKTTSVIYGSEHFSDAQDYIECCLRLEGDTEVIFSGPVSLYDRIRLDVEAPNYKKKTTSWDVASIDQAILADMPDYGRISNLEPFFSFVRSGRLTVGQLRALVRHLGLNNVENEFEAIKDTTKMSEMVKQSVQMWKQTKGTEATLVEFLTVLRLSDVSLANIVMEIVHNTANSRCGLPSLAIY